MIIVILSMRFDEADLVQTNTLFCSTKDFKVDYPLRVHALSFLV